MWQHSLWVHSGPAHILEASGSCAIRPSVRSRGGKGLGGGVAAAVCRCWRRLVLCVYVHTHTALLGSLGLELSAALQLYHLTALRRPPDLTVGRCAPLTCMTLVRLIMPLPCL